MRHHTTSKVKGITNTHLAIASVAALAASSFALAAFPMSPTITQKNSASYNCSAEIVTNTRTCRLKNGSSGFKSFVYTCPNGKKLQASNVCRPESELVAIGTKVCMSRRYCVKKPLNTATTHAFGTSVPTPRPDLSFIGRPEENVSFYTEDGAYKVKVRYINSGTAEFGPLSDIRGGANIMVSFLDKDQKEAQNTYSLNQAVQPLKPGESFEQVFVFPADLSALLAAGEASYIKVQLNIGDATPTDPRYDVRADNNFLIVELPASYPFPTLSLPETNQTF